MASTVTSKGQVTIPKEIRMMFNIKPSDKIDFFVEDGKVILKPVKTLSDFRGAIARKGKGNIATERACVKKAVSKRILAESE